MSATLSAHRRKKPSRPAEPPEDGRLVWGGRGTCPVCARTLVIKPREARSLDPWRDLADLWVYLRIGDGKGVYAAERGCTLVHVDCKRRIEARHGRERPLTQNECDLVRLRAWRAGWTPERPGFASPSSVLAALRGARRAALSENTERGKDDAEHLGALADGLGACYRRRRERAEAIQSQQRGSTTHINGLKVPPRSEPPCRDGRRTNCGAKPCLIAHLLSAEGMAS